MYVIGKLTPGTSGEKRRSEERSSESMTPERVRVLVTSPTYDGGEEEEECEKGA